MHSGQVLFSRSGYATRADAWEAVFTELSHRYPTHPDIRQGFEYYYRNVELKRASVSTSPINIGTFNYRDSNGMPIEYYALGVRIFP